jgi:hypothetical protein
VLRHFFCEDSESTEVKGTERKLLLLSQFLQPEGLNVPLFDEIDASIGTSPNYIRSFAVDDDCLKCNRIAYKFL